MKAVILIRDGNTARLLERQIQAPGNADETVIISDPGKALRYLEEHPADAVFLDIDGEADWQSICGMVKYADKRICLVLLSGSPLNAVKAFEAGASDFLSKPVEREKLERAISRCARTG